jgi:pyruvate dehydrogenase E2 component (dihydrolipoamide acetyltransferase)
MEILMPKLGLTMTEGTLTRWTVAAGDAVQQGETLFEFESEKSLMEYECPADGALTEILVAAGETVPCGTPVARLQTGQRQSAPTQSAPKADPVQMGTASAPVTVVQTGGINATPAAKRLARQQGIDLTTVSGQGPQGRIHLVDVQAAASGKAGKTATPLAKRIAAELQVNWTDLPGSGPGGRVVKADVQQAGQPRPVATPADPHVSVEPLTGVRRVIAQRMSDSAFSAPHVTIFTDADASHLVAARTQLNTELNGRAKLSYNAWLMALTARALREHPALNACLVDDKIHRYRDINIALAVDTERGLLVPVVRHVDTLNLVAIQQAGDALIQRALAGKSWPDDLSGGTFTLTNLGMYDIDGFTPIINQPQAAILGVGRIQPRPVVVDGAIQARPMLTLSLSFDHRLVDGAPAARFLQRVKQLIERPFALLLQD